MAMQSGESPRRVRAQIEKRGLMDVLQNQILERKGAGTWCSRRRSSTTSPTSPKPLDVEAIYLAAGGGDGAAAFQMPGSEDAEPPKTEAEDKS